MNTAKSIDQTETRACAQRAKNVRTKELTATEHRFFTAYKQLIRHFWQCGVNDRLAVDPLEQTWIGNHAALSLIGRRCALAYIDGWHGTKEPPDFESSEDCRAFVRLELIPASEAAQRALGRFCSASDVGG